ncbi:hypothetical protein Tco_1286133 [Tanacetum coccineum]
MCQRRWIELFSDYECEIRYHPGKVNVVADALSRKEWVKPTRDRKEEDEEVCIFLDRIWEPLVGDVRMVILNEAHKSKYYVHLGADKMYHDLRDMPKHQRPRGYTTTNTEIPEWKWDKISMDLITKLPREVSEIIYRCNCGTSWSARVDYFGSRWAIYFTLLENLVTLKLIDLRLLEELNSVHDNFHVSNLKKCLADANLHVPLDEIKVDKTLCFVEEPVKIMD